MIVILLKKNQQKNSRNNILVSEKIIKNTQNLQFQQKKKLQELIKMQKKLQKGYLTYYYLMIAQDLWQAHY